MGNSASGIRRKLGDTIQERVFQRSLPAPLSPEQIGVCDTYPMLMFPHP